MGADSQVSGTDLRVLGPVEVVVDGVQVPVPPGTQRTLLAMLLLGHGHAVSVTRLADGLWGEHQPHDPRASLHTTVARLRRALDGTGVALRTVSPGYVLDLPENALDADRFASLHARGRELLADRAVPSSEGSRPVEAVRLLESALGLWRGAAWGEFAEGLASGEARRLEEARVAAREDLATALLQGGCNAEAVATLESVVRENPLRDRAVGLLVDALHRYGRTADALSTFDSYRKLLADELGLDPSPALSALHQRVLRQELPTQQPATPITRIPSARVPTDHVPTDHVPGERLIGRDEEATVLSAMLAMAGLVTLVGPGGIGKSRLAQQVARDSGPFFWVDLAPVRDRPGVLQAVAEALDVETRPGERLETVLSELLSTDPGVVVLDNCEHVVEHVAAFSELATPTGRVLATSRERLGVRGERVFVLEPLRLPEPGEVDEHAPAVELFLARARDVGADLGEDEDVIRRVGEVCRALDGLPLALELGAARTGALTLDDLAERLDRRFDLLTRGPRTAPRRHRTLRSVVDWSYDLLDDEERAVFTRLAVFPAGFDLAAAETVVGDETIPATRIADVVAQLADRSMIVRPRGPGRGKYRLLETLRQYALSRLDSGDLADLRRRHAQWVLELAKEARAGLAGVDEGRWSRLLDDVLEDLRAAWRWSLEAEDLETSERLVEATWRWSHWRLRPDVLGWGDRLLEIRPREVPVVALTAAIGRAWHDGRFEEAERLAGLAPERDEGSPEHADLLEVLADILMARGEMGPAVELYHRAERIHAAHDEAVPTSLVCSNRVLALAYAGLPREETLERALKLAVATDNPTAIAFVRFAEGESCAEEDVPRALSALDEAITIADDVGNRLISEVARTAQVSLLGRASEVDLSTLERFGRVILTWSAGHNPGVLVTALRNLVVLLARMGRFEDAVVLWAAIGALRSTSVSYGPEAERIDSALSSARVVLGSAFDEALLRGQGHTGLADVTSLAMRLCEEAAREVAPRSGQVVPR